jgi:hypothetical protein
MTPVQLCKLDCLAFRCDRFEGVFEDDVLSVLGDLSEPELWALAGMLTAASYSTRRFGSSAMRRPSTAGGRALIRGSSCGTTRSARHDRRTHDPEIPRLRTTAQAVDPKSFKSP